MVEGELMGYKALINKNLTFAFNQIQDLAEDVILKKSSNNDFSFESGTVSQKIVDKSIKAVIVKSNKMSSSHNSAVRQLMLKAEGVGDLNAYDTVSFEGKDWRFGPVINSDGYIIFVEVYREG